jgi:pimeloyl-ACP methyl ester carboxylesterase
MADLTHNQEKKASSKRALPDHIEVGEGTTRRKIAILSRSAPLDAEEKPGLFWLGGFKSDMMGSKALALDKIGALEGLSVTRFDYSGHGVSGGQFLEGSISQWLADSLAVFNLTNGPQILIGSSMGGWLAMLLNRFLRQNGQSRVAAMVLIAPAIDMTQDLMRQSFSAQEKLDLETKGRVEQPSEYSDEPYVLTKKLIDDGDRHLLFGAGTLSTGCPVVILQGGQDPDVPVAHAMKLLSHLTNDPVVFTLIPDGDHRLSRDQDLAKLKDVILQILVKKIG